MSDTDHDHLVGRNEFADFIFHMAAADLAHGGAPMAARFWQSRLTCHMHLIDAIKLFCKFQFGGVTQVPVQCTTPSDIQTGNESILTDFFEKGDLAAGLQAWLRLTNNEIPGLDSNLRLPEGDTKESQL